MDWPPTGHGQNVGPSASTASAQNSRPGSLVHPTENDIILGRGVLHAGHAGNRRFYAVIDQYIPMYNAAKTRTEKTRVVQIIYDVLTSVGRFVKEDPPSAACVVIDADAAKKKISHAIRYRRKPERAASAATAGRRARSESPRSRSSSPLPGSQARGRQRPQQRQLQLEGQEEQKQQAHIPQQRLPNIQTRRQYTSHAQIEQMQPMMLQERGLQLHQQMDRQLPPQSHTPQQQALLLPPLQQQYQQVIDQAVTPQQASAGGGSPESLFADEELDSVLLPPDVMAAAPMPHADFFDDDGMEDETVGDLSSHGR